jgi:hypothetical protein
MDLGWKRLIPAALVWLILIAVIQVGNDRDWPIWLAPAIGVAIAGAVFALLAGALRPAAERRVAQPEGAH